MHKINYTLLLLGAQCAMQGGAVAWWHIDGHAAQVASGRVGGAASLGGGAAQQGALSVVGWGMR
jgi:hypothetical protein